MVLKAESKSRAQWSISSTLGTLWMARTGNGGGSFPADVKRLCRRSSQDLGRAWRLNWMFIVTQHSVR